MKRLLITVIEISLGFLVLIILYFAVYDRIINLNVPVKLKWRCKTGFYKLSSPVVVNGVIYLGNQRDYIYAIDKETGKLKWEYYKNGAVFTSPYVVDGIVFVGSYYPFSLTNDHLCAIDATSGILKWRLELGGRSGSGSPVVADGIIYIESAEGHLYAIDTNSGKLKWRFETGHTIHETPSVANNVVYIGIGGEINDYLYAIDAKSGDLKWRYEVESMIKLAPYVYNDVVYIGGYYVNAENNYYFLSALEVKSGELKWQYKTG